ncbi:hypothetical protein [Streptomyces peucetius]|uniref:Uncharacterized protein n=1 Tax=Streptomyces peucetius TaxID=1950 RepID=A0ABY6I9J4_STRPE|nr:hypothetical protein [Streptomyces peucetius]UYQ63663.1 hypothetical protein OGH68_20840 [Streptomyces peucetius]
MKPAWALRPEHVTVRVAAPGVAVLYTRAVVVVLEPAGRRTVGNAAEVTVPPLVHPLAVTDSVAP